MKPKYKPCTNCGANEYTIVDLKTVKCEYCGTEYEIELPKQKHYRNSGIPVGTCYTEDYYNEWGEIIYTVQK